MSGDQAETIDGLREKVADLEADKRTLVATALAHVPEKDGGLLIVRMPTGPDPLHGPSQAELAERLARFMQDAVRRSRIYCDVIVLPDNISLEMLTEDGLEKIGFRRIDPDYLAAARDVSA